MVPYDAFLIYVNAMFVCLLSSPHCHSASNGHTTCLRLLLDESDTADLIDAADSQGQ